MVESIDQFFKKVNDTLDWYVSLQSTISFLAQEAKTAKELVIPSRPWYANLLGERLYGVLGGDSSCANMLRDYHAERKSMVGIGKAKKGVEKFLADVNSLMFGYGEKVRGFNLGPNSQVPVYSNGVQLTVVDCEELLFTLSKTNDELIDDIFSVQDFRQKRILKLETALLEFSKERIEIVKRKYQISEYCRF